VHAEAGRLLVGDLARSCDVRDVVNPEAAVAVAALARGLERRDVGRLDPSSAASSASVGARPSLPASWLRKPGSASPLRRKCRSFCSTLTYIRSPTTRTLWVCE
jgi:hypothetical protein